MHAVDFVIVTALEEERDAIIRLIPHATQLPPTTGDPRVYFVGRVECSSLGNLSYTVVLVSLVDMGRVQASATINDAIRAWSPKFVLLVGIAGGIAAQGARLGDVLIADQVVDYSLQKQTSSSTSHRWKVYPVDLALLEAARNRNIDGWHNLITAERPEPGEPQRLIGTVASGDTVIADENFLQALRNTWPKLLGVEMEASGVALICHQAHTRPGFFMVRGVSDHADSGKDLATTTTWRAYACDAAASYAIALLRSCPVLPASSQQGPRPRRLDLIRDFQPDSDPSSENV